jgi:hypothetical protein
LDRDTLSYTVKILEGKPPASFKESSLFIDILGRWRMAAYGAALGEQRGIAEGEAAARAPAPLLPLPLLRLLLRRVRRRNRPVHRRRRRA